jgi:hypothetical protein
MAASFDCVFVKFLLEATTGNLLPTEIFFESLQVVLKGVSLSSLSLCFSFHVIDGCLMTVDFKTEPSGFFFKFAAFLLDPVILLLQSAKFFPKIVAIFLVNSYLVVRRSAVLPKVADFFLNSVVFFLETGDGTFQALAFLCMVVDLLLHGGYGCLVVSNYTLFFVFFGCRTSTLFEFELLN